MAKSIARAQDNMRAFFFPVCCYIHCEECQSCRSCVHSDL